MAVCGKCHRDVPEGALFCSLCGAAVKPDTGESEADPLIGTTIAGKYFVHQLLGRGGMGDVYKATHLTLDRPVVLKLLKKSLLSDPSLVQRFHREARAASRLNHANSITIIDFGQADDGTLFMAMEYLAGRPLSAAIAEEWPLSEARVVHIGAQILAALAEAHALGVIHRDLKPANVMLEPRRDDPDFVKVLDFGIAKLNDPGAGAPQLTQAGLVCGTPGYMSPEQVRGEELDPRSDLYAVGVLLYELITGLQPFEADTMMGLMTKALVEEPPSMAVRRAGISVSPDLEALVMQALAKDRNARPAGAEQMRAALLACNVAREDGARATPAGMPRSTVVFDPSKLPSTPAGWAATPAGPKPRPRPSPSPLPSEGPDFVAQAAAAVRSLPGVAVAPRPPTPRTPAPRTPAPRTRAPRTPAPRISSGAPRTPAPARGSRAAQAPRHEYDELEQEAEPMPAPSPGFLGAIRERLPLVGAIGGAAVVLLVLAVWGLTRSPSRPEAPRARAVQGRSPAPEPHPPLSATPVQPIPPAESGPSPREAAVPPASPAAAAGSAFAPAGSAARNEAPAPVMRKGLRVVRGELNVVATPSASSGDGVLAVVATPWGEVFVDGKAVGETPREMRLGAGSYRVKVRHPQLGTREQVVSIVPGKRRTWTVTFTQ